MADLFTSLRAGGPHAQQMRYRFEKSGLTLEGQPIPWNAEAVIVETRIHLPTPGVSRLPQDFTLRLPSQSAAIPTEDVVPGNKPGEVLVSFRFPVPGLSTMGEVFYRTRSLGQLALPVLSRREFLKRLQLTLATASVRLPSGSVACQAFVGSQCQGLILSAVVQTAGQPPLCLLPLSELGLRVEVGQVNGGLLATIPVQLSSSQLSSHQALISAAAPKPRRVGAWRVTWRLGEQELATQRLQAITKPAFLRSLRVVSSRFVIQDSAGQLQMSAHVPDHGVVRAGPCFLLASSTQGIAGQAPVRTVVRLKGGLQSPILRAEDALISDGPSAVLPGTLDGADLAQVEAFELLGPRGLLARLPLGPVPTATFTAEGGFKIRDDFDWSAAADEQLQEKLAKLLG